MCLLAGSTANAPQSAVSRPGMSVLDDDELGGNDGRKFMNTGPRTKLDPGLPHLAGDGHEDDEDDDNDDDDTDDESDSDLYEIYQRNRSKLEQLCGEKLPVQFHVKQSVCACMRQLIRCIRTA